MTLRDSWEKGTGTICAKHPPGRSGKWCLSPFPSGPVNLYCMTTDFRVDLNVFRGPMDLLLYLVRKHEVEITDIPIAAITDQYLNYLARAGATGYRRGGRFRGDGEPADRDQVAAGAAARATRWKRSWKTRGSELVRRLLEYKKYRDAASLLEERSRRWQERYPRLADDLPGHEHDPASEPIHEVELWDLVSAFGRIMRETEAARPSSIVYDDTPIHVYMGRIHARLSGGPAGSVSATCFSRSMHKSTLIGIFLAVLELVRHAPRPRRSERAVRRNLDRARTPDSAAPLDLSNVDEYEGGSGQKQCQMLSHDQQLPRQNARPQRPHDRGLFPRGGADLLARSRS